MNMKSGKCTVMLLLSLLSLHIAHAQTNPAPGSQVMVLLSGSGTDWASFTYTDGRIDYVTNQISVNLLFHPYSPQVSGYFFSSTQADFSGTINITTTATETKPGLSVTDNFQNQLNYTEPGYTVEALFFGPQFVGVTPGNVASLALNPPTGGTQNPEPYELSFDGTNQTLTVWITLPSPFNQDVVGWPISCTASVTSNGSSFSGLVQDASTKVPLPGATVVIGGQTLTTDTNGSFFVPYLPPGSLTIQITDSGYGSYQNTAILPPFSAVQATFSLNACPTISGQVACACDGSPIANASVQIGTYSATTDSSGNYSITNISPGTYTATVSANNYVTTNTTVTIPSGASSVTHNFALSPPGTLVIVDANPLFLNSTLLPQPITPALLSALGTASTTRKVAAADGITKLLLQFTTCTPGAVVFSLSVGSGGTLSNVDGSALPASGIHTTAVGTQQMAFALYTVPDQVGSGSVSLGSSFAPDGQSTSFQQTPWSLQLLQTPVVLVHGLWDTGTAWDGMKGPLDDANINFEKVVYYDPLLCSAGRFYIYHGVVVNQIQQMLATQRSAGIAVTRADVVAHSMGGILTRMDAYNSDNFRPDNYNMGYIRRVITVDTPHWGATPAQFLYDLAQDSPGFETFMAAAGHPILYGAVQDLSPYSFAGLSGGTSSAARQPLALPSCAVSCSVHYDDDFSLPLSFIYGLAKVRELALNPSYQALFQNLLCGENLAITDDDVAIEGKLFFRGWDDGIVGTSSQAGGCGSVANFADTDHINAPNSPAVQSAIIQLLQGPVSAFASSGFPAVTAGDLSTQICNSGASTAVKEPNPLGGHFSPQAQISLITLTLPTNGSTANPGDQISMQAQPVPGATVQEVDFVVTSENNQVVAWDIITNFPFSNTITLPTNLLGPLTITAAGQDAQGDYDIEQATIEILPGPGLTLQSISVYPTNLSFSQLMTPQALDLTGTYSDGVQRDITVGGAGTGYSTSAPLVANVDQNGNVSASGNGTAQITVTNGGLTMQVPVQVSLQPPQVLSIQPNSLEPGMSNVSLIITGLNLGGTTNLLFLRNGQPDANLTVGGLVFGANAANIQIEVSIASNTAPGLLAVVATTPVGSSTQAAVQGNRFFVGNPLALGNLGFHNAGTGGAGFGFSVLGSTGSTVIIQSSTNLVNWCNESTNTLTFGSFNFIETNAPASSRFYQVELLP
jgi:pimeloyl-ACP methyl ester carboxylesterase